MTCPLPRARGRAGTRDRAGTGYGAGPGDGVGRRTGGAPAAGAALGVAALSGARFHRGLWLALGAGALAGVVFVHWLIAQSLYALNKLCPYCAVVWIVTIAPFWYVTVHCLDQGILPAPGGCWTSSGTPTGCCSTPGTA